MSSGGQVNASMLDLFSIEVENHCTALLDILLNFDNSDDRNGDLEKLMRAAHSIKGAAKLVNVLSAVKIAHAMEDCFVAAQKNALTTDHGAIDLFISSVDLLARIGKFSIAQHQQPDAEFSHQLTSLLQQLQGLRPGTDTAADNSSPSQQPALAAPCETTDVMGRPENEPAAAASRRANGQENLTADAVVRVSARRINRLMSLGGELSVTTSWLGQYSSSMLNLKRRHNDMIDAIDRLRSVMEQDNIPELQRELLSSIQLKAEEYREALTGNIISLDDYDRRAGSLTSRLNHEIIASRMRPFRDGTQGYKRMVRDIARSLNKKVRLVIAGEDTQVDRDILEKIDAPINHMIRNAIDHGIESPEERSRAGKNEYGTIRLQASHSGGRLSIVVEDDGRGVDIETIRQRALEKNLVNRSMADKLSRSELLDFLFLPSFSTRDEVTELSGRGVGLNVVHSALQEMHGKLHSTTEPGKGMHINLELPLTLSVVRSLLVEINHELYAFPLATIHNVLKVEKSDIFILEDKQYISIDNQHIGLIHSAQVLGLSNDAAANDYLSVVVIGDWNNLYGVVVDDLHGERGLALRLLNNRLGKIKDISAAAITDDGSPVLVFDVDDLILSIKDIVSGRDIIKVGREFNQQDSTSKRVLVVDDSLTVREVEKKLLESRGYLVDVAVDGVDAWNTVRSGKYRLVISDVDMPRMNGIELVTLIKADAALRNTPVMMVSYKDRPEDKQKGLEAGADYYLTKGSFHDETLVEAVKDLIGDAI